MRKKCSCTLSLRSAEVGGDGCTIFVYPNPSNFTAVEEACSVLKGGEQGQDTVSLFSSANSAFALLLCFGGMGWGDFLPPRLQNWRVGATGKG